MRFKQKFRRLWPQLVFILFDRRGGITLPDDEFPIPPKLKEAVTKIGGTTYIVRSFFNRKSERTVLDKVSRLIDREISPKRRE
ncbi:MAG: transposon-encoded TnpW family protein [Ethanoligenens sp.]